MKLAPSILSADFARLAACVAEVEPEADLLHVDVMDGHFVPNLTIGPPVVAALSRHTQLFLDCHLMVTEPEVLLEAFQQAGAGGITVHVEVGRTMALIDAIRALGLRVGLSLNPDTPFSAVSPYLDRIDLLLVMSVHPGFGGQAFIPEALGKVRAARREIERRGLSCEIQIDGGINAETAPLALAAGADILVAGSAVFGADDPRAAAAALRAVAVPA